MVQVLANDLMEMPRTHQIIVPGDDMSTILQKLDALGFKLGEGARHELFRRACVRGDLSR